MENPAPKDIRFHNEYLGKPYRLHAKVPPLRTPIYYDAEFTGLHRDTTLVSIGLYCAETGSYFYGEFTDYDPSQVDDWLREHVLSNLMLRDRPENSYGMNHDPITKAVSTMVKGDHNHVREYLLPWLEEISRVTGRKLQFYTDCYAYDWVLLNDLICEDGLATNLPKYIDYIPIDLSTQLLMSGIDPDASREDLAGDEWSEKLIKLPPFSLMHGDPKHNSLWDAIIAYICFCNLADVKGERR